MHIVKLLQTWLIDSANVPLNVRNTIDDTEGDSQSGPKQDSLYHTKIDLCVVCMSERLKHWILIVYIINLLYRASEIFP